MKELILLLSVCFVCFSFKAQYNNPPTERHPEIGLYHPMHSKYQNAEEEITARTAHSRLFVLPDGGKISGFSDVPLHFKNEKEEWISYDYRLGKSENQYVFPVNAPWVSFEANNKSLTLSKNNFIQLGGNITMGGITVTGDKKIRHAENNNASTHQKDETLLVLNNLVNGISKEITFNASYLKTDYILNSSPDLNDTKWFFIEEDLTIPVGWYFQTINGNKIQDKKLINQPIALLDENGQVQQVFTLPSITDGSTPANPIIEMNGVQRPAPKYATEDRKRAQTDGYYQLTKLSENNYRLAIAVANDWLQSSNRIFPVVIDPIVIVENLNALPSCFFPNYEIGSLNVNIPVNDTITETFLLWEFTAVNNSGAWTEDQRSFVSSTNGSTPVFIGTGATEGVQTYTTSTNIANGNSTGSVSFDFHASRVWGGSGCNATFNFINRRYIEVTHFDAINFGPGLIVINEYSASNRQVLDAFGNFEDWVELYNTSNNFVDLTGYYLSDNPNNPTKWQMPTVFIGPGQFLRVICSGRDTLAGGIPHANFRLSQLQPEHILLSEPNGTLLESYQLWVTQNGHSYGRTSNGGPDWGVFANPTPGATNMNAFLGYTEKPTFSIAPGFYNSPVLVALSGAGAGEVIRYTLDGSEPNAQSTLYVSPISISQTTVVRARCFDNSGQKLPGFMETNTYFINESFSLPVFSFSGDQLLTLFNGTQIEPLGGVEFFDENGDLIDESYCEFDKHGNDSWQYPQRGVDFVSRDEYGYNAELSSKFFETKNRENFQRLMVKAAANDNYPFEQGGAHIRDSYVQSLSQLTDLEMDERSSTNCIVFVNGQYWGVYDLREKVDDKDFTRFYYNQRRKYKGSEEYVQFIKTWGNTVPKYGEAKAIQDWGTTRNFILNNNMGDPANFAIADSLFDITSMIDHKVVNSFIVSRDWLNYNTGWWRGLNASGDARKWRYILWDTEAAFGHYINWTGLPDASVNAPICQIESLNVGDGHIAILNKFMDENPEVRQRYITRYADLLNTKFHCNNLIHVLDSMIGVIEPEMPKQLDRWGGTMQEWQQNVDDLKQWIEDRCEVVKQSMLTCYDLTGPYDVTFEVEPAGAGKIKMNSEWLPNYPFEAFVYGNISTLLTAEGNGQYLFSHWEVTNHNILPHSDSLNTFLEINQNATIKAVFYDPNDSGQDLIYYWHFNDLSTSSGDVKYIAADYSIFPNFIPDMTYTGVGGRDMDEFNPGSLLNLHLLQSDGKAARIRNPAVNRSLTFNVASDGYENLVFEYAVHRSGQGMLFHQIAYSIDGVNFIQTDLPFTTVAIQENYELVSIDFSSISVVNNNPNFTVQITFNGNTNQSNGNNRIDNITLKGDPMPLGINEWTENDIVVYPNPFQTTFEIKSTTTFDHIEVVDLTGRLLYRISDKPSKTKTISSSSWSPGVYLVKIGKGEQVAVKRVVKQ